MFVWRQRALELRNSAECGFMRSHARRCAGQLMVDFEEGRGRPKKVGYA
jgi:hypothetical protein